MLSDTELDNYFTKWGIPEKTRRLLREARTNGPVRDVQRLTDNVRTRYESKVMDGPLLAESRTVELPAIVLHDKAKETLEIWPQPFKIDLVVASAAGAHTRLQHTPDLLLLRSDGIRIEEWREEERLNKMAARRPEHFKKDELGRWHYLPAEEYFQSLGIDYFLRSADELPRIFLANIRFLNDYSREGTPQVPAEVAEQLTNLLVEHKKIPYLKLVYEHQFQADHIWRLIFDGRLWADLHQQRLDAVDDLILFQNETYFRAHNLFGGKQTLMLPRGAMHLQVGMKFVFDGHRYEIIMLGDNALVAKDDRGETTNLPVADVLDLFQKGDLEASDESRTINREFDMTSVVTDHQRLEKALSRLHAIENPDLSSLSKRTLRRLRQKINGVHSRQDQIQTLGTPASGNTNSRLPEKVIELALIAAAEHNKPKRRTVSASFAHFVVLCEESGLKPMAESSFYEWMKRHEDVNAREGKRAAYQKDPIPLHYDYDDPVNGVLSHAVVYIDHTIANVFLRGRTVENLGKPTFSIAVDGGATCTRAMYLSFDAPSAQVVLMILRDYVRRNGRLPETIVLDNGSEFHSVALKLFCSYYKINIRWRRRSRPRDSAMVERMLGATEQEVISALDGNTIALKDPRMVSSSVHPENFIKWTLPGLHAAIEQYLFHVHPNRKHPRLGETPRERERRIARELGARRHAMVVRYDAELRLMTAPHSGTPTRQIDRRRGVYVDGMFYWHDKLAQARNKETAEVRVEMWCARIVYVNFRGEWLIGQARDGGRLDGRFRHEFEIAKRTENRAKRAVAQQDRKSARVSKEKTRLWIPENWDPRLREQAMEAHYLYEKLEMTEVLAQARSDKSQLLDPNAIDVASSHSRIAVMTVKADLAAPPAIPLPAPNAIPVPVIAHQVAVAETATATLSDPLNVLLTGASVEQLHAELLQDDYF